MVTDNRITESELLIYLLARDNIDVATVAEEVVRMKRQEYLSQHKYNIWASSDGYWKTKVKGSDGKYRQIKRRNKTDLEDAIVEYYKEHSKDETFKQRFDKWIERQRNCGRSENTILKYRSDYKRFYENYPIEHYDIRDINEEILSKHILQVFKDKQIRWRAFKEIMGYTDGVFEKARRDKVISENPISYLDLPIYKKYCYVPPVKSTKQRILTENDTHILLKYLHNPKAHNVNQMCCFAVEMALYTGMRVGELAALMWNDIVFDEELIIIRHSEKFDRTTKQSVISTTKTGKERIFPLIEEIKNLLYRVRDFEIENGFYGEFVFQDKDGRLTKSKISDAARNYTMSDEFSSIKSIHAIRRTVNSRMKCDGVSTTIASSLLGHTERVNEQNYTYDVSELKEKQKIIRKIAENV